MLCVLGLGDNDSVPKLLKLNPAPQNESHWPEGLLLARGRHAGEFSWRFPFVTQSGTVPDSQQQNKDTSPVPLPHGTPYSGKARAGKIWICSDSVDTEQKQTSTTAGSRGLQAGAHHSMIAS